MVQKFGLEGLLSIDEKSRTQYVIETSVEKEEASIENKKSGQTRQLKVFDTLMIEIRADMVEYRRTVSLILVL